MKQKNDCGFNSTPTNAGNTVSNWQSARVTEYDPENWYAILDIGDGVGASIRTSTLNKGGLYYISAGDMILVRLENGSARVFATEAKSIT